MRVTFNSFVNIAEPILDQQGSLQATLEQQISSGQSVSEASDDPLTASRILNLQTASSEAQQNYQNASYALNVSTAGYNAVNAIQQLSTSAGQIAVDASDPITGSDSSTANAAQVNDLLEEAVSAGNQEFNGSYVLGGTNTETPPFSVTRDSSGDITAVTYVGSANGASIPVGNNTSVTPSTDGATNSSLADFMNQLVSLRDALTNNDTSTISTLQPELTQSTTNLNNTVGQLSAQQSELQNIQNETTTSYNAMSAQIGQDDGVNLATAATALTQSQTAYQAAIDAESKVMSKSLLDYIS
jgi:flagellar hook-associated protein 3 FlgL